MRAGSGGEEVRYTAKLLLTNHITACPAATGCEDLLSVPPTNNMGEGKSPASPS